MGTQGKLVASDLLEAEGQVTTQFTGEKEVVLPSNLVIRRYAPQDGRTVMVGSTVAESPELSVDATLMKLEDQNWVVTTPSNELGPGIDAAQIHMIFVKKATFDSAFPAPTEASIMFRKCSMLADLLVHHFSANMHCIDEEMDKALFDNFVSPSIPV